MTLDSIGNLIFFLVIILFIHASVKAIKQIYSEQSEPGTILGLFGLLCLFIIILLYLIFEINKLHIIWNLILVYLLSRTKYAFRIGTVLFNLICFILKKSNVVKDKDNVFRK